MGKVTENRSRGFSRVDAYSTAGGNDRAYLYDSAGDNKFYASGESAWFDGTEFTNFARGFDRVSAYSLEGGVDNKDLQIVDYVLETFGDFWNDV